MIERKDSTTVRNIIITGGELFNKGAQAMTFVAVDECKKRFPDHEIYVLSEMDLRRPKEEREQYAFKFTGWYPIQFAKCQSNPLLRTAHLLRHGKELEACEKLYRNCDLMIDVSGYGLGSNWGVNQLTNYLNHLEFAKAFDIPCYLMPQSFGPFEFRGEKETQGNRVQNLLSSVKLICAREQEGYDELRSRYQLENVVLYPDLVLSNSGIDVRNVFTSPAPINIPVIHENSVAIIPNNKCTEVEDETKLLSLYQAIIEYLLNREKTVYLLSHATTDRELCEKIKSLFSSTEKVIWLDQDFSCLEFNALVSHFEFLVASRFHSIVHAFKNGVPCIALGWAVKYSILMREFSQDDYCFDLRDGLESERLVAAIDRMSLANKDERTMILKQMKRIQSKNAFDLLSLEKY